MYALVLDTSTSRTVCGLVSVEPDGVREVAAQTLLPPAKAGESLHPLIAQVLAQANAAGLRGAHDQPLSLHDLGALVASLGPGSFTGLRVGLSAAKGLAYALKLPLVGVSSLRALARALARAPGAPGPLVATLEARRGELFLAAYALAGSETQGQRALVELSPPTVLRAQAVPAWLAALPASTPPAVALLVGAGAHSNRAALVHAGIAEARILGERAPLAPTVLGLAQEAFVQLGTARFELTALFALAPDYLSQSEPEKALSEGRVGKLIAGS